MHRRPRLLLAAALCAMTLAVATLIPGSASADTTLGGGLAYQTNAGDVGIHGRGVFGFTPRLRIVPNINVYLGSGTWTTLNGDLHMKFIGGKGLNAYGLGGIQYATGLGSGEVGVNLGGGVELLGRTAHRFFIEGKYVISDYDGFVIQGGILFELGGGDGDAK